MSNDAQGAAFPTTRWTGIARAISANEITSQPAMEQFCSAYWQPLYCFARRLGRGPEDAADATQGFFLTLIRGHLLDNAEPQRGRLRTYLLTLFKRALSHEKRDHSALKREGGYEHISLDVERWERTYQTTPCTNETPENLYHRRWALCLLETALTAVEQQPPPGKRPEVFGLLRPHLVQEEDATPLSLVAQQLNVPEGTVRSWLYRLRLTYHRQLWEIVAATLETPTEDAIRSEIMEISRYFSS